MNGVHGLFSVYLQVKQESPARSRAQPNYFVRSDFLKSVLHNANPAIVQKICRFCRSRQLVHPPDHVLYGGRPYGGFVNSVVTERGLEGVMYGGFL